MTAPFDYYKQHLYCIAGRKAVKSYPEGVYRCVQYGGACAYLKCCNIHKNGGKTKEDGNDKS